MDINVIHIHTYKPVRARFCFSVLCSCFSLESLLDQWTCPRLWVCERALVCVFERTFFVCLCVGECTCLWVDGLYFSGSISQHAITRNENLEEWSLLGTVHHFYFFCDYSQLFSVAFITGCARSITLHLNSLYSIINNPQPIFFILAFILLRPAQMYNWIESTAGGRLWGCLSLHVPHFPCREDLGWKLWWEVLMGPLCAL